MVEIWNFHAISNFRLVSVVACSLQLHLREGVFTCVTYHTAIGFLAWLYHDMRVLCGLRHATSSSCVVIVVHGTTW